MAQIKDNEVWTDPNLCPSKCDFCGLAASEANPIHIHGGSYLHRFCKEQADAITFFDRLDELKTWDTREFTYNYANSRGQALIQVIDSAIRDAKRCFDLELTLEATMMVIKNRMVPVQ